jgi:hypothetical protein
MSQDKASSEYGSCHTILATLERLDMIRLFAFPMCFWSRANKLSFLWIGNFRLVLAHDVLQRRFNDAVGPANRVPHIRVVDLDL